MNKSEVFSPDTRQSVRETVASVAEDAGRDPKEISIVAVTKGFSPEVIEAAHSEGFNAVGENRVSEVLEKQQAVEPSCREAVDWHFIGHLQSNKVKKIIGSFTLIHSVDRISLIKELDKRLGREGETQDVLLQVNVSGEESKYGAPPEQAEKLVEEILTRDPLALRGLMTMAPWTDDDSVIEATFRKCRELRDRLAERFSVALPELSMGMTNDYKIAVREGATLVRLGRALFGERE